MRKRETHTQPHSYAAGMAAWNNKLPAPVTIFPPFGIRCSHQHNDIIDDAKKRYVTFTKTGQRPLAYKPVRTRHFIVTKCDSAIHRYTGYDVAYENWYEGNPNAMIEAMQHTPVQWADVGAGAYGYCLGYASDPMTRHYERWVKVKPTMATRANLSVFLAELTDVKRMFAIIPRKHLKADSWSEIASIFRVKTKDDLKKSLRYANSQHLNYNFGWKPFVADIVAAANAAKSFERRLYKFLYNQGSLTKLHASDADEEISTYSLVPLYGQSRHWKEVVVKGKRTRHSTFQLLYEVPPYGRREMRLRAWMDSLGLNPTIANVWECIPFSFVVDWVYDFGSLLKSSSSDWIEPWLYFCQACSSVKVELEVTVSYCHGPNSSDIRVRLPGVCGKFVQYSRQVGWPSFSGLGSLDSDKIRLSASLVGARL